MRRLAVALLLLSCACDSIDDAKKKNAPGAEKTLAAVEKIAADLRARKDGSSPAKPDGPVVLDFGESASEANATLVYEEDLAKRGELGQIYARIDGTGWVSQCAAFLDHGTYAWDPKNPAKWNDGVAGFDVERTLSGCGRWKHLFVIRTVALAKTTSSRVVDVSDGGVALPDSPSIGTCADPKKRCSFRPAFVKAEVHMYSLDPVAHRGVLVVEAESSEKLRYSGESTVAATVESDLTAASKKALLDALAQKAPWVSIKGGS